jgi:hypothetical protein
VKRKENEKCGRICEILGRREGPSRQQKEGLLLIIDG